MHGLGGVRTVAAATAALAAVALAWTSAGAAVPAVGGLSLAAVAAVPVPPHTFSSPDDVTAAAIMAAAVSTVSGCGAPSSTSVPDGKAIVVRIPPAKAFTVGKISKAMWHMPPVADPAWQLQFYGFMWLQPLAQRAANDGQSKSLSALVDQMVSFHRLNPDPRKSEYGWDEGSAMRRLTAENCLFVVTGSKRLIPGMIADANVQLGSRYYGPPNNRVHNHGLMANLTLLKAAGLLKNTSWRSTAVRRLRTESTQAFSSKGTTYEQSSGYQQVNISLWNLARKALEDLSGNADAARTIRQVAVKATRVFAWLTEPDGRIVLIGDSDEMKGTTRSKAQDRVFRDDQAGLGVGRWSWSDPRTTYYTVRYGPPTKAHGQPDRGGVTWSALGARVLVGPGRYTYRSTSKFYGYARNQSSHDVAYPVGRKLKNNSTVTVSKLSYTSTKHAWQFRDSLYGLLHARAVLVDARAHRLTVTDTFAGRTSLQQKWHLDASWRLSSVSRTGHTATFARSDGRRLVATSTGRFSVLRGSTRPVAGWHFPSLGHRTPNVELTVSARTTATTTFTIS